ncbi:MAG: hypothetical protein ACHP83_11940, partial [Burkholderiales bacterium]
ESLALVEFQDEPTLRAWRMHPEHVQVQVQAISPNTTCRSARPHARTRPIARVADATSPRREPDAGAADAPAGGAQADDF